MLRPPSPSDFDDGRLSQRYRAAMERSRCPCCGGKLQPLDESPNWVMMGLGCMPCGVSYNVGSQGIGKPELVIFGQNNYRSFLQSILADPLDDTNRLVFADWLEEHDEPNRACYQRLEVAKRDVLREPQNDEARLRYADAAETMGWKDMAELVRVQVGLSQIPNSDYSTPSIRRKLERLQERQSNILMTAYRSGMPVEQWQGILDRDHPFFEIVGTWRRGFIHSITLSAEQAETYLDEVLEEQPVQEVTLSTPIQLTNGIEMREGKPHVLIAGKWVDYSIRQNPRGTYIASYPELDKIMFNARWPSVPVGGWKLPSRDTLVDQLTEYWIPLDLSLLVAQNTASAVATGPDQQSRRSQ